VNFSICSAIDIRLGLAVLVAADFGSLVAVAQGSEHGLEFRPSHEHSPGTVQIAQSGEKFLAVLEEFLLTIFAECVKEGADFLLSLLAGLDFPQADTRSLLSEGALGEEQNKQSAKCESASNAAKRRGKGVSRFGVPASLAAGQ
jgi:hypothetical protein